MRRLLLPSLVLVFLLFLCYIPPVYSQDNRLYQFYIEEANRALEKGEYKKAIYYFDTAQTIFPDAKTPLQYTNLIKRLQKDAKAKVGGIENELILSENKFVIERVVPKKKKSLPIEIEQMKPKRKKFQPFVIERMTPITAPALSQEKKPVKETPAFVIERIVPSRNKVIKSAALKEAFVEDSEKEIMIKKSSLKKKEVLATFEDAGILYLDEPLWQRQPDTSLNIELGKGIILEGDKVERFLILTEGFVQVERTNKDQLLLSAKKRGATFLHIWDARGRWTFYVTVVFPQSQAAQDREESLMTEEYYEKPFRFEYSNNWAGYYKGDSIDNMQERSVTFTQWMGVFGDTPYGKFDASGNYYKFEESTELVGQRIGLTDATIGPFSDFTIRGYDDFESFSELSLPGRNFRGGSLDAYAFNRNINYTYFIGQDRSTITTILPGVIEDRKSYIEGAQITLFPDDDKRYTINYARGWGEARPDALKDRVYSVETYHKIKDINFYTDVGYDEDEFSGIFQSEIVRDDYLFRMKLRDIHPDFNTITGSPSGQGEVGGDLHFKWDPGKVVLSSFLDIYRDREFFNPDRKNWLNFDFNSSLYIPIDDTSSWNTSLYYIDTQQLISPNKNFRINNNFSKNISLLNRNVSFSIGHNYQFNRFRLNPEGEYDRHGLTAGVSFPLFKSMHYYFRYDYSWVNDIFNDERSEPSAINTGLTYSARLRDNLSTHLSVSYRDEENTDANFSYLAGEDSLTGNIGFSFHPMADVEIFLDSRLSNVWAESADRDSYVEADVRIGLRSGWDVPFHWSPASTVYGFVYKDVNGNAFKGANEPGIKDVRVKVGKKTVTTDQNGEYRTKVRAKEVLVQVDADSLPKGFVFSSPLSRKVKIEHLKSQKVNFGLTARSGLYGVVYHDQNQNRMLDPQDAVISNVNIVLDGTEILTTDFSGSFFYENITAGKHVVSLDVNSLPLEYLPLIKIKNEIDVKEGATFVFHIPLRKKGE